MGVKFATIRPMQKIRAILNNLLQKIKNNMKKSITIAIVIVAVISTLYIFWGLPTPYDLQNYKKVPLSTHILDRNGKLLYEVFGEQNRTPVKLLTLPKHIYQATVAIEDKDYFKHGGVSVVGGILRAVKDSILQHQLQGGSTLTQQLVRSALLSPERTIRRKLREIILAIWTEKVYSKQQLLEMYLNQVPYGGSAYGIEEAARTYFNKPANDLTLDQAAFLAGLTRAPSFYSPFVNPDLALARRDEVLRKMFEQKYITQQQYESAKNKPLKINPPKNNIKAPHFVFYIKSELEKEFGSDEVEEGGLKVTTTLDLDIQEEAEQILREELKDIESLNVSNGAILVTRPPTGEVLSMVGSVDYFASPSGAYNVTTALRQPGSSIKPINYAIGLDRRLVTAATVFLDVPTCFQSFPRQYCPVNYDGRFHGPQSLRTALGSSYNIPAVKMLAMNTVRDFVASSSAFTMTTFKDPSNYGLSLTLGGGEVRMTEMAQAFSSFANHGIPKKLKSILKVEDRNGKILYEFKDTNFIKDVRKPLKNPNFLAITGQKAISQESAFIISHILLDNNARSPAFGSNSLLVVPGHAVSVKTGTTDDKRDNWTIGYTPNFMTTVWVGNNDNSPMNPYLASGITGAAPIWNRVMRYALSKQPDLFPIRPNSVVGRQVCWDTGTVTSKNPDGSQPGCPTRFEYLIKGTEGVSNLKTTKGPVFVTKDSDKYVEKPNPGDSNLDQKEKTIVSDGISSYCIDCAGDVITSPTPTPAP